MTPVVESVLFLSSLGGVSLDFPLDLPVGLQLSRPRPPSRPPPSLLLPPRLDRPLRSFFSFFSFLFFISVLFEEA